MFHHHGLDMLLSTDVGGGLMAVGLVAGVVFYWLRQKRQARKILPERDDVP
jgi:hypothetical protein